MSTVLYYIPCRPWRATGASWDERHGRLQAGRLLAAAAGAGRRPLPLPLAPELGLPLPSPMAWGADVPGWGLLHMHFPVAVAHGGGRLYGCAR